MTDYINFVDLSYALKSSMSVSSWLGAKWRSDYMSELLSWSTKHFSFKGSAVAFVGIFKYLRSFGTNTACFSTLKSITF